MSHVYYYRKVNVRQTVTYHHHRRLNCHSTLCPEVDQWPVSIELRGHTNTAGGRAEEHSLCKPCCAHSFEGPGWSFVLCRGSPMWNKPCSTIWGVQECYTLCARLRRTNSGSDLGPSSGGHQPPAWWFTAALTLPERRCPGLGSILGPCGHGAEALLNEPPSHVWKCLLGTSLLSTG